MSSELHNKLGNDWENTYATPTSLWKLKNTEYLQKDENCVKVFLYASSCDNIKSPQYETCFCKGQ